MRRETKLYGWVMLGVLVITILYILLMSDKVLSQTFKINRSDAFNSKAMQWGVEIHDKPAHATRGIINSELGRFLLPESLKQYSELFAVGFSIAWEIYDGFDWRRSGGAEAKDIIAETAGVFVSWGYRKMNRDQRIFFLPVVGYIMYNLIKVK